MARTRKPVVEVRRSQRRRRTVSAYRDGERVVVLIPDRFSRAEETEWVERMLARLAAREERIQRTDDELLARARRLTNRYLPDHATRVVPASVRWVTNQNGRAWFDQAGNFSTSAAHMVERFTLIDADTIHYQVTIDDPTVYTRAWTMAFALKRNKQPGFRLLEEACHEGERNAQPLIDLGYRIFPGIPGRAAK